MAGFFITLFTFSASAPLFLGAVSATIDLDDQVMLLQAELAAKAEEKQDVYVVGSDDEDSSCPMSSQGLPNTPCAESRSKAASPETGLVMEEPPLFGSISALKKEVQTEDKPDTPEAAVSAPTAAVGYFVDLLVLVVICDGLRRWRQKAPAPLKTPSLKTRACVDGWQGFMKAAMEGDVERCQLLSIDGVDLDRTDVWGCTVLHAAARGGKVQIVDSLLEQGAKVDCIDAWDETPLHLAARAGHADVCDLLVERGAAVDAVNAQDWTPLVVAAHEGKEDTCKALLARGGGAGNLEDKDIPSLLSSLLLQQVIAGGSALEDDGAAMEQEALRREREDFMEQFAKDD